MWSALRSDLVELVSVVKEDTNVVIEKINEEQEHRKITAATQESIRRMGLEETFTVPLLVRIDETAEAEVANKSDDGEEGEGEEANSGVTTDDDEEEETPRPEMTDEEIKDVEDFLKDFDVKTHKDEITKLLDEYPTLKANYDELVPDYITYDAFWERYYYRCDVKRIELEWKREEEKAREARAKLMGNVTNFFGGVAKATASMAGALTEDDDGNPGKAPAMFSGATSGGVRPPFVLNTAVDEDDDEEELGWDDDDEEEEEDDDDNGDGRGDGSGDDERGSTRSGGRMSSNLSNSGAILHSSDSIEEIEFKDEQLETTKEQLKQVEEERDQLHQTINLLKNEINALKNGDVLIDTLRKELNDKEHELRTVKHELENEMTKSMKGKDDKDNLDAKIQHLNTLLSTKDLQITKIQETFDTTKKQMEDSITLLKTENEQLKKQLLSSTDGQSSSTQLVQVENDLAAAREMIASLTTKLSTTQDKLESYEEQNEALTMELQAVKEASLNNNRNDNNNNGAVTTTATTTTAQTLPTAAPATEEADSGGSGGTKSDSTGVKVDKPVVAKISTDDDDDDGWGDDW